MHSKKFWERPLLQVYQLVKPLLQDSQKLIKHSLCSRHKTQAISCVLRITNHYFPFLNQLLLLTGQLVKLSAHEIVTKSQILVRIPLLHGKKFLERPLLQCHQFTKPLGQNFVEASKRIIALCLTNCSLQRSQLSILAWSPRILQPCILFIVSGPLFIPNSALCLHTRSQTCSKSGQCNARSSASCSCKYETSSSKYSGLAMAVFGRQKGQTQVEFRNIKCQTNSVAATLGPPYKRSSLSLLQWIILPLFCSLALHNNKYDNAKNAQHRYSFFGFAYNYLSFIVKNICAVFLWNIKTLWLELNTSSWQQKQIMYSYWWLLRPKPSPLLLTVPCRRYISNKSYVDTIFGYTQAIQENPKKDNRQKKQAKSHVAPLFCITCYLKVLRPTRTPVLRSKSSPEKPNCLLLERCLRTNVKENRQKRRVTPAMPLLSSESITY